MPNTVWYSTSPYGTGDIRNGSPNISITSGIATLSVAQTGNIGCGCCIEYNSLRVYIAPNRIGFDSGGTVEIEPGDKIQGGTSGATGVIRAVELMSGSWAGGDAAGYIYFETTSGTWQDNEQINRIRPSSSTDVGMTNGTLEGTLGGTNTQFVVKTATGGTPVNQTSTSVISIHHEYASLSALETGFIDANHVNNTDLTSTGADVIVFTCCYYDHDDQTADTTSFGIDFGTTDSTHWFQIFTPVGAAESVNSQRHDGKWNIGKYLFDNNSSITGGSLSVRIDYCKLDGLQLRSNPVSGYSGVLGNGRIARTSGANLTEVRNCIIRGHNDTPSSDYSITLLSLNYGNYDNWTFINCIVYESNSTLMWANYRANDIKLFNCVGYDAQTRGFTIEASGTIQCANCAVFNTGDDFYVSITISHCASDDGDGEYAVTPSDWSTVFVDYINGDFHLESTDTDLMDAGTDLSSVGFWRDIDGEDRIGGTWDIGSDEYIAAGGQTASLTDTLSLSETYGSLARYIATLTDSLTLTGVRINVGHFKRSLTDSLSMSESRADIGHFNRSLADTATLTDVLSTLANFKASLSDTITLTDSATVTAHFKGATSDTFTLTDNLAALLAAIATLADTLTLTDSITYPLGQTASLADTLTLTDTQAAKAALLAALTDVLTLTDVTAALVAFKAVLTDTFNLTDALSTRIVGTLTDTLTLTDSISGLTAFLASVIDTLTMTDSLTGAIHFNVTLSDTLTLSEQMSTLAAYAITLADTLTLTDSITGISITAVGEVTVTFTGSLPDITFTARQPGVGFTGK